MMRTSDILFFLIATLYSGLVTAHGVAPDAATPLTRVIEFPDAADYDVLVVDLHTHSVFSDGHVWPIIRVEEALRDGLDAMAVTEHLEWQPHLEDIPHPDRNRAYQQTVEAAADSDLIVIAGSEITRGAPAGHMNAVFLTDANKLIRKPAVKQPFNPREYATDASKWSAQEAVEAANRQGAFVFWNHPYWTRQTPDGIARMPDFHRDNAANGLLHGIEVANGQDYSEEAFAIALEHDLTLVGVSDVHNLVDWDYALHEGGHRPVTLVFASDRSAAAIREALFDGRSVVWFRNMLMGREDLVLPLVKASLSVEDVAYLDDSSVLQLTLRNTSDATYKLRNKTPMTFMDTTDLIEVPAQGSITLQLKPGRKVNSAELRFDVLNVLVAPKINPELSLPVLVNP